MKPDSAIVETSHGPATVKYVREFDIPHWHSATVHAQGVARKLMAAIGMPALKPKCPHCGKEI